MAPSVSTTRSPGAGSSGSAGSRVRSPAAPPASSPAPRPPPRPPRAPPPPPRRSRLAPQGLRPQRQPGQLRQQLGRLAEIGRRAEPYGPLGRARAQPRPGRQPQRRLQHTPAPPAPL